jgi:hypothetical protein
VDLRSRIDLNMKQISIEWKGEEFTISENEAFALGERLEDIVALTELAEMSVRPKFFKLARCYAEMLNFAGARTTPEQVHSAMMAELKTSDEAKKQVMIATAIQTLLEILMDGAPEAEASDDKKKTSRSSKGASS